MIALVGKYFFIGTEEHYTYGKITESLSNDYYMIYKFGCENPYNCVFHISQLTDGMGNKFCQLFDSEKELNDYVKWIEEEESESSNVVKLVKKNDDRI